MRGVEQIPWLYDLYMGFIDRFGFGRWRRWVVSGALGRTLEVGCGTGHFTRWFGGQGLQATGLDLSLPMLAVFRGDAESSAPDAASVEVPDSDAPPSLTGSSSGASMGSGAGGSVAVGLTSAIVSVTPVVVAEVTLGSASTDSTRDRIRSIQPQPSRQGVH